MESFAENERVSPDRVREILFGGQFSTVAVVHCETSSGVVNPVEEIGSVVSQHGSGDVPLVPVWQE